MFPAAAGDYGVVAHEHPTKEDLFDLDWDQVDERYDPRLLSEDLINESQSDSDHKDDSRRRQAEHCYFEARKYEHGQKVSAAPILHYVPPPLSQAKVLSSTWRTLLELRGNSMGEGEGELYK